ncbi:MAG: metallophosphoesterase [Oscillospiraceae bacterium]
MSAAPKRHLGIKITAALIIICAALLLLGKYGLSVTHLEISSARLPSAFDGFRVVQLSDLHGSSFGRGNARLINAVAKETPDVIVLTGDFLDEGKADAELPELETLVASLLKLAPVCYVSGNHDWASGGLESLAELFERLGASYLRNEYIALERGGEHLVLAGVEDPNGHADMLKPDELVDIINSEQPDAYVMLLGHRNYWAEKYPDLQVDIIFCGHAHGGIVRLPGLGGLFGTDAKLLPRYEDGVFRSGRYDMIVSRGLGNSVPLPRFLNTPEIISVTLREKK